MNFQNYYNQQIIGWLSYNPYFEARDSYNTDNRVCYIYPRFLVNNGRFDPIDNKQDFPQVGRIAVRIQGQDNASDVYNRYGSVVSFRIKILPTPNYEANNYYTVRYNYQLGRERSEIWIDRIDGNAFYQVFNINQSIMDVIRYPEFEAPFNLNEVFTNSILLRSLRDQRIYGPFEYTTRGNLIHVNGLDRFDYIVGSYELYGHTGLSNNILSIADQNDNFAVDILPAGKITNPNVTDPCYDMIDMTHLIDLFLDKAKTQLSYSRNEFRELKDLFARVADGRTKLDLSDERVTRLKVMLPRLFRQEDQYKKLLELTIENDNLRHHLIDTIYEEDGDNLLSSLSSSTVNSIRTAVNNKLESYLQTDGSRVSSVSVTTATPSSDSSAAATAASATAASATAAAGVSAGTATSGAMGAARLKAGIVLPDGGTDINGRKLVGDVDGSLFNFMQNANVRAHIDALLDEGTLVDNHLKMVVNDLNMLRDKDVDIAGLSFVDGMEPELITHSMQVARLLCGFVDNLRFIMEGAAVFTDADAGAGASSTSSLVSKSKGSSSNKQGNTKQELDGLVGKAKTLCASLKQSLEVLDASELLKNYQEQFNSSENQDKRDSLQLLSFAANSKKSYSSAQKHAQTLQQKSEIEQAISEVKKRQQAQAQAQANGKSQVNTSRLHELQQKLEAVQKELDDYKKRDELTSNIKVIRSRLDLISQEYKERLERLDSYDEKIKQQEEKSNAIKAELQKAINDYKDDVKVAVRMIDTNLFSSAMGLSLDVGAPQLAQAIKAMSQQGMLNAAAAAEASDSAGSSLSGSEAEIAAAVAAGVADESTTVAAADASAAAAAGATTGAGAGAGEQGATRASDTGTAASAAAAAAAAKGAPKFAVELLAPAESVDSASKIIERVGDYLSEFGNRNIEPNDVTNYLICISQGFITTFAGEPGTGKTSLCNLLARALGLARMEQDENSRFTEVSVERGWTSLKDLIGYYNPLSKRMEKSNAEVFDAFVRLNKEAAMASNGEAYDADQIAPYFILLDEANLSPIEHYWAAFFRNCDFNLLGKRSISLGGNANWALPEHLRFLATVNFDHTTEELSARFLDRSWVITLEPTSVQMDIEEMPDHDEAMVSFGSLKRAFVPQGNERIDDALLNKWQVIQDIFASDACAMPIRPRNLKMVYNYCAIAASCMERNSPSTKFAPLDFAVAQKILPTINGSGERYMTLVDELLKECSKQSMPLCYRHLKRIQRNGGADLGFYQFFAR